MDSLGTAFRFGKEHKEDLASQPDDHWAVWAQIVNETADLSVYQ
jgi:hypothetical protein